MKPVVSVCIANYNGIDIIDACIRSVQEQECRFAYEIIIHDDASDDDSVRHIRTYHPEVRLIESTVNVGFCVANNRMAAKANGDYLLLLNNDAELLPDALQSLHDEACSLDEPAILSLPQFDRNTGELIDRGCLLDPFFNPVPNLDPDRQDVAMVIGACLWVPRRLWDELGGFPEWFGSIAEDMYLCSRARLNGHPVRVCDRSGYRHHVGYSFGGGKVVAGRLSISSRRRALSERNKTFTMSICEPLPLLVVLLPVHLALHYLEGIVLLVFIRDPSIWRTIYAPLLGEIRRHRRQLMTARNAAQRARRIGSARWLSTTVWMPRKLQLLLRFGMPRIH